MACLTELVTALGRFLFSILQKTLHLGTSWSFCEGFVVQKSLLILQSKTLHLKSQRAFWNRDGIVIRWASYSQRPARCTVDSAWILQQFNLMMRWKSESRNAHQTQLKSRRMCLNDTGDVNHVEGSPHFNFLGPRSMIFAAGCSSFKQSRLHGSCCWNRTEAAWSGQPALWWKLIILKNFRTLHRLFKGGWRVGEESKTLHLWSFPEVFLEVFENKRRFWVKKTLHDVFLVKCFSEVLKIRNDLITFF